MRHAFASQQKLAKEVEEIRSFLLKSAQQNTAEFRKIWKALETLAQPEEEKEERRIGFKLDQS